MTLSGLRARVAATRRRMASSSSRPRAEDEPERRGGRGGAEMSRHRAERRRRNIDVDAMTILNQATNLSEATGNIVLGPLSSSPCAATNSTRSHQEKSDPETVDVAPR